MIISSDPPFKEGLALRGGYKDSVGGGKNFQFSARSAPKFFYPP